MRVRVFLFHVLAIAIALTINAGSLSAEESYAIAMHGAPALPADFTHMPYANPDAPKGGRLVQGFLGTFDSLNPLIVRGLAVQQIRGFVVESLMARGNDEAFTLYGLLAKSVETDDVRSFVTFHLDPRARFSDGQRVLAEDVLFSWALLRDKGRPNHRQYYSKVVKAEAPDPRTVRFDLGGANDRELPLILGLMPVLPKHAIDVATFEDTSMSPPIGSGPYRVSAVKPGASMTLTRNPDYWGRDLPVNRGLWNFDEVMLDFEWINRNYFFGLYGRSASFFAGSELSAYARTADDRERELLKPFAAHLRADILDGSYRLPVTDGSGRDRATLRSALTLLSEAGYDLDGTVLRQRSTKAPLTFEILVTTRDQERIALAYTRDLKRAGIEATVRAVDAVQFEQRRLGFDFDMMHNRWDQSLSPGNEQWFYWGSEAADHQGTRNYMGAKDPAIDATIAALLEARERPAFVSAVRALDRALMSGFYAIPLYNVGEQWIARWNRIERPVATALTGYLPETWWQKAGFSTKVSP